MGENVRSLSAHLLQSFEAYFQKIGLTECEVVPEWNAFKHSERVRTYSPRVDVAVGPFSTGEAQNLSGLYSNLFQQMQSLVEDLRALHDTNCINQGIGITDPQIDEYRNARCFISVEIERSGSRKHRLGDLVNASALGYIGIIIAWDEKVLRSFLRIQEYLDFLSRVGKPSFNSRNLHIITKKQALDVFG